MTQASYSHEFSPTPAFGSLTGRTDASAGIGPAASLWLLALTSLTLVFASLLLFGLLAQGAVGDGYVRGFATAVATLTGGLGLIAAGYVLLTAHRAGYLRAPQAQHRTTEPVAPVGLRVAPVVPAGLAYRKRQQRAAERAERRKQARAIDAVQSKPQAPRAPVPAPVRATAPQAPIRTPAAQTPARPPVAPPRPADPRPAPVHQTVAPPRMRPAVRPVTAPTRVSQPVMPVTRPATGPAAAPVMPRLNPPTVRPRGQAALLQVGVAGVRAPFVPRQPHPVLQRSVPQR